MKKLFSIFWIFLFFQLQFFGQSETEQKLISYETADIDEKIDLFFLFFTNLEYIDADSLLYYIEDLYQNGNRLERKDAVAMAQYGLSYYLQQNSLYDEAHLNVDKAIQFYESAGNDTMLVETYNAKGNLAYLQGQLGMAKNHYEKSYQYGLKVKDLRFIMLSVYNLAKIDVQLGHIENAQKKLEEYIHFHSSEKGSKFALSSAYSVLGEIYLAKEDLVTAKKYFEKSADLGFQLGSFTMLSNAYTNLAITAFFDDDFETSAEYFRFALDYAIKDKSYFKIAESYYNLGDYFYGIKMYDSAIVNYYKSAEIAENIKAFGTKKDALLQLSELYQEIHQAEKQIETLKEIIETQEKINNYQVSKENKALNFNFGQSYHELQNLGQKRERKLEEQVAQIQSNFNDWLFIGMTCFVIFFGVAFYLKRKKTGS